MSANSRSRNRIRFAFSDICIASRIASSFAESTEALLFGEYICQETQEHIKTTPSMTSEARNSSLDSSPTEFVAP